MRLRCSGAGLNSRLLLSLAYCHLLLSIAKLEHTMVQFEVARIKKVSHILIGSVGSAGKMWAVKELESALEAKGGGGYCCRL